MSRSYHLVNVSALVLSLGIACGANSAEAQSNRGWWVVLGSVGLPDMVFTSETKVVVDRIAAAARRCGLKPFWDFSSKFSNFMPGYLVVVVGAYGSKIGADRVLATAKGCLPGAYLKQGSYAGE